MSHNSPIEPTSGEGLQFVERNTISWEDDARSYVAAGEAVYIQLVTMCLRQNYWQISLELWGVDGWRVWVGLCPKGKEVACFLDVKMAHRQEYQGEGLSAGASENYEHVWSASCS